MQRQRALKRFGQNYLIDKNIIKKIAEEIAPKRGETIVEIGPGQGALTEELQTYDINLIGVEIDKRVKDDLKEHFPGINFISTDFLELDLQQLTQNNKIRVVGNIPYNITSPILFKLIDELSIVEDAVFTVQYEVAKRISAEKGSKDYSILSVILGYLAEIDLCFKISPHVFRPKPKVSSALIHLYFNKRLDPSVDVKFFIKVVKAAFGNRRKSLKNSLSNSIFGTYDLRNTNIDLTRRAEELSINEFVSLTKYLQEKTNGK
jgi:16S rRNA (adenine1518-N6/adenine1519-N6)-dimethyltransferase